MMDIVVLGATGHVGRHLVEDLAARGHAVTAVSRELGPTPGGRVRMAQADVLDTPRLLHLFSEADRAFLLNPPASHAGDADIEERRTAEVIVAALEGSGLGRIVAQSTWGARPGHGFGDLSVLHHFETLLAPQEVPATIMRASYLMSNWDAPIRQATETGELVTLLPEDLSLPMVSPRDLARVAADLLTGDAPSAPVHVEGPGRYTPRDVANALSAVLERRVTCRVVPRGEWDGFYRGIGFSPEAARSFAEMTGAVVDGDTEMPESSVIGTVPLQEHVAEAVRT